VTLGRISFYRRYATRSLRRGGQRTVLAIFCIAVGVMATVALRLAGNMIAVSITGNVREANGGDVALQSTALPLAAADLRTFDTLRTQGLVIDYLPLGVQVGSARLAAGRTLRLFTYVLDDPARFPLVGRPSFDRPSGASFASALGPGDSIVVSRFIAEQLGVSVGQQVRFTLSGGGARMLTVGGILANRVGAGGPTTAYISGATYHALASAPEHYGVVDVLTTGDAASATVADILRGDFPAATVQTVHEALATNQQFSDNINQFLDIVGLLALLIGGIGIVNTVQVLLSRRRIEIAVLKTTGYRRRDLYFLFGAETATLGLLGGLLGTAVGVGLSVLVKVLVERVLTIDLTFTLDAGIVVEGVLIGVVTALIFGLLPIARAAEVRPAAVLRDAATTASTTSRAVSAGLYAMVVVLFGAMAAILLGDPGLAIAVVLGALALIGLLSGAFYAVVVAVGRLPVPERLTPGYATLVSAAVLASALIAIPLRGIGVALLALTLCGFVVVVLPRRRRNIVKLALRSVGRSRARTSTTMVALFIGVFTIGLIAVVGEDVSSTISASLSSLADYSVFVIASPADATQATSASAGLPGVQARRVTEDVAAQPDAINSVPTTQYVAARGGAAAPSAGDSGEFRLSSLSGVEGYAIAGGSLPDTDVASGRILTRADAGGDNVLVPNRLAQPPLSLHLGDVVTLSNQDSHTTAAVHIVGFYQQATRSSAGLKLKFFFEPILADASVVRQLGTATASTIVALQVDESQRTTVLASLYAHAPDTTILDLTDLSAIVQQILGNVIDLLIAIASLALFAGIVIIANAVALAMLERRRELGILKATGHTSASVLAQVLLENAVVGALSAIAGMLMVTLATVPLGRVVLKTDLAVSTPTVLLIIVGIMVLTTGVAALVAWRPTRLRPLEVLRYE
jgi:predicted lysophospholipase L1 biosynthesis ABC-type transport system permease subunit